VIQQPGVTTVIPGASTVAQAVANAEAAQLPALGEQTLTALEELYHRRIQAQVHHRW
jgi:aryl-alcohol dehydrogenase-like predicted oxidoreductase